ncbi:MAG: S-layer homology domain-containing protein, partial [Anaerovoracaceae bacterium]
CTEGCGINDKWGFVYTTPDGARKIWSFRDVSEEDELTLTSKCIVGFPDGNFHPEETVTYGQACTILRNLTKPECRQDSLSCYYAEEEYKAQEHWAKWAVWGTVSNCGYLYPAATFAGREGNFAREVTNVNYEYKMTRKDVAYLIGMYCDSENYVMPTSSFSDYQLDASHHTDIFQTVPFATSPTERPLPAYYYNGVAGLKRAYTWDCYLMSCNLKYADIITGYPDGTFRPDQLVTRAEFVTIIYKALENCIIPNNDTVVPPDCVGHWAEEYIAKCYAAGGVA